MRSRVFACGLVIAQISSAAGGQKLVEVIEASDGKWSTEVRGAYLNQARSEMLAELKKSGNSVTPELQKMIDKSLVARMAVYGSVYPADSRILLNLDHLKKELGDELFQRYFQFCLGASVARRSVGVGPIANARVNLKFTKIYEWGDEARAAGRNPSEFLASRASEALGESAVVTQGVIAYLKEHHLSAKDAYISDDHRQALEKHLATHNVKKPERALPSVLHQVILAESQRPSKRSDYPSVASFLRFLDRNQLTPRSKLTLEDGQKWPIYPIQKTPWPMLMPLSMTWPLDEAEYIWQKYQGRHGDRRLHMYGPYNRFPKWVVPSLAPSKWHWSAWPSVIITGGICGTMSSIANGTSTSLGVPILKAGQPGHSCIVRYDVNDNGEYLASVGQSATGGPDKTTAAWLFADDQKCRAKGKYSVFSEYHYGLAQGMNVGLASYLDTRMAMHLYKAASDTAQKKQARTLVMSALSANPCNIEAWYVLSRDSKSGDELIDLIAAFQTSLNSKSIRELHSDRDASSDLGDDKVNPKSSVDAKIATIRHIGLTQILVLAMQDMDRYSQADLKKLSAQIDQMIQSGEQQLQPMQDRVRCKLQGAESLQRELSTNLKKHLQSPPKGRKQLNRARAALSQRIQAVAQATSQRSSREQWLRELLDLFSASQKVKVSKKKGKQLDKFYLSIVDVLGKSLKAKPVDRKALRQMKSENNALLK